MLMYSRSKHPFWSWRRYWQLGVLIYMLALWAYQTKGQGITASKMSGAVTAERLAGHIFSDARNTPLPGATVTLCDAEWNATNVTAVSRNDGWFALPQTASAGKEQHILVTAEGRNPLHLTVQLSDHSGFLKIVMTSASS